MAKNKIPSAYEVALGAACVPVRKIVEMIEGLDHNDLNKATCVVSYYVLIEENLAKSIAESVIAWYTPRFRGCSIRYTRSAYDQKLLITQYSFYTNSPWEGVRIWNG